MRRDVAGEPCRRYRCAREERAADRDRLVGRDRARGAAAEARQGRPRQPGGRAGRRRDRADRAQPGLGRMPRRRGADRGADAGDARRSRGPPPLSQRRRDARPAARRWAWCRSSTRMTASRPRKSASATMTGSPRAWRRRRARRACCCCPTSMGCTTATPAQPGATLIERVPRIDAAIEAMAGGSSSGMGSGGMTSKVQAARDRDARRDRARHRQRAGRSSARALCRDRARHAVRRRARRVGAQGVARRAAERARDDPCRCRRGRGASAGQEPAARRRGADRGPVRARRPRGDRGAGRRRSPTALAEYDAADAARIAGKRSDEAAAILGYAPRAALGASQPYGAGMTVIALTGGTGFVGSHVIDQALAAGHRTARAHSPAAARARGRDVDRRARSTIPAASRRWSRAPTRCCTSRA